MLVAGISLPYVFAIFLEFTITALRDYAGKIFQTYSLRNEVTKSSNVLTMDVETGNIFIAGNR